MSKESEKSILSKLNDKIRWVKKSSYAIPIYILTVFIASIWMVIFNPCIANLLLPFFCLLIPYKLYDENNMKKLFVVGIVAIILIGLSIGIYHTQILYTQPEEQLLDSEREYLTNGTIDNIYGDSETTFNFTVEVDDIILEQDHNVSVNITQGFVEEPYESYNMTRIGDTNEFYVEVDGLSESLFNHRFYLRSEYIEEEYDFDHGWVRSESGFGPVTIDRTAAIGIITVEQSFYTVIFFILLLGVLWLKKRMDKSLTESTEGLDEKEEKLEDQCPECGHLLEGMNECDRCGWIKETENEILDEDGEPE